MSAQDVLAVPPWRLAVGQRDYLRRNRAVADRYEARWRVVLF